MIVVWVSKPIEISGKSEVRPPRGLCMGTETAIETPWFQKGHIPIVKRTFYPLFTPPFSYVGDGSLLLVKEKMTELPCS